MSDTPPDAETRAAGAASSDIRRWLPLMGLAVSVWALLPRYSGPALNTEDRVEFADHVVPAIVVFLVCLACLALRSRRASGAGLRGPNAAAGLGLIPFGAGLVVLLAGFWMLATHIPLVVEALNDQAPWDATIYHTSSALAVFGLGLLWATSHWSDLSAVEAQAEAEKGNTGS